MNYTFKAVALFIFSLPALAHDGRPLYIELTETSSEHYLLQWKTPSLISLFNIPVVALPETCEQQTLLTQQTVTDGVLSQVNYFCVEGLEGKVIRFNYPGVNPSLSTLIYYRTVAGEKHTALLDPMENNWSVPYSETVSNVAQQYTLLGIKHIWAGIDHLLFILCLLWIAGSWQRILITITGFTLAHSVTLIFSALNIVRLPVAPVEACIALSIMFLAVEIAKGPRENLVWRYPVTVSSSFGLLHGFGFATVLNEFGLPQTEALTGLLFFNLGVEIGQVLFAFGVVILITLLRQVALKRISFLSEVISARVAINYSVGGLSAFWLIQRCTEFLPSM